MKTSFDVAITAYHAVQVSVPGIGDVSFPAGGVLQLNNASKSTIEYFRSLVDIGFKTEIGKKVSNAFMTYDYDKGGSSKDSFDKKVEEEREKAAVHNVSPLEKVSNYIIQSGSHKGERIKDIKVSNLKIMLKKSQNETDKSAINSFLILTNQI